MNEKTFVDLPAVHSSAGACIAVVLLIRPVMLQQLNAGLAEEVVAVAQLGADVAAQIIALDLEDFDRTEFWFVGHGDSSNGAKTGQSQCEALVH